MLDQAYAEYLEPEEDDGGLALAESAANVFVTRTFSKIYGLAAERIGWGYGAAPLIDAMHRIRAPLPAIERGQFAARRPGGRRPAAGRAAATLGPG